jgi:hypothetical protein
MREANMFQSLENSWRLVKASYNVLRADKELLVFPLLSSIGLILVSILFFIPVSATGLFDEVARAGDGGRVSNSTMIIGIVILFFYYLANYTVIIFSNTALIGAALIRLKGGDPTVRDGFRIASERFGYILGYAVISATVGMILNGLRNRDNNIVAQIAGGILGMAWNLLTFLVIPVLVVENLGPIEAIKRSGSLLKKTWGEQVIGNFGIGTVFGLIAFLVVLLIGAPLFYLFANNGSVVGIIIAIAVIVLILGVLGIFASALSGIYQAALYRYATEGEVGDYFEEAMIKNAFRPR